MIFSTAFPPPAPVYRIFPRPALKWIFFSRCTTSFLFLFKLRSAPHAAFIRTAKKKKSFLIVTPFLRRAFINRLLFLLLHSSSRQRIYVALRYVKLYPSQACHVFFLSLSLSSSQLFVPFRPRTLIFPSREKRVTNAPTALNKFSTVRLSRNHVTSISFSFFRLVCSQFWFSKGIEKIVEKYRARIKGLL